MTSLSDANSTDSRRVTIRDVAREAGVGIKTVSRVINDEPHVAPATAERVRTAIALLQWEPDSLASNLRRTHGRTKSIGLLLGSVDNPFAATIHRAIEDVAAKHGVAVLASSLDEDPVREVAAVENFLRRKVDGLILTCSTGSQAYLADMVPEKVPVVFIDREPAEYTADVVRSDNFGGAAMGTRHLLSRGHRRIAGLFDKPRIWTAAQRQAGFLSAMDEFGIGEGEYSILDDVSTSAIAERAVLEILSSPRPPTAIFSSQNLITIGAVRALRKLAWQRQVALVGFDDIELGDLLDPGVTVIAQRAAEIGVTAAERMFEQLEMRSSGSSLPSADLVLGVDLVVRGSGEIEPGTR
ncbi:LacI family DNA-binding transcriptional regulator [Leifsonia sp. fls2-241-R2A-40a]|uniref:LacI family DNA-binding transcriptional regulator n=1 Tax=Leifsonia sp. fls2-241-R2A-40a TaxID=3040290 RepID=UPI00254D2405|nr:LacI family DNA-binding transcriptional regulator [Leifsonia sp. fls2-241-R2A-40a]